MTPAQLRGHARAASLSPERRAEISYYAGKARWAGREYRWCRGTCGRELPLDAPGEAVCPSCLRAEKRAEAKRRYWRRKGQEAPKDGLATKTLRRLPHEFLAPPGWVLDPSSACRQRRYMDRQLALREARRLGVPVPPWAEVQK